MNECVYPSILLHYMCLRTVQAFLWIIRMCHPLILSMPRTCSGSWTMISVIWVWSLPSPWRRMFLGPWRKCLSNQEVPPFWSPRTTRSDIADIVLLCKTFLYLFFSFSSFYTLWSLTLPFALWCLGWSPSVLQALSAVIDDGSRVRVDNLQIKLFLL